VIVPLIVGAALLLIVWLQATYPGLSVFGASYTTANPLPF